MLLGRRQLVRRGLWGGLLLALGGGATIALRSTRLGPPPKAPLRVLTRDEHAIFAAVAARVVPGDGAASSWPRSDDVDVAGRADALMARAHPATAREFRQLLHLFETGFVGLLALSRPTPFTRLDGAGQDARLEAWRRSRLALLRTGYQALVRLAHALYFAAPETYAAVGYPGPPVVPQAS